jgi:hypothetical protein
MLNQSDVRARDSGLELPFAADCCPCAEKLRTVLPFTVDIRDGAVQLVSTLGGDAGAGVRRRRPTWRRARRAWRSQRSKGCTTSR